MSEKNKFSKLESGLTSQQWEAYIPLNTYAVKAPYELPAFIQDNGLSKKFNSALVVASASTDYNFFGVIGYRPDKKNTVIDEHAYVYLVNNRTQEVIGGILDHAVYHDRTFQIPQNIQDVLNLLGVTASISVSRIPEPTTGTLEDLQKMGILTGVSANFNISYNKMQ